MRVTILDSVACEELTEKVSFRQRLKGDEKAMQVSGRRMIWAREKKKIQSLQGRSVSGMFNKHLQGSQCSLSSVSKR